MEYSAVMRAVWESQTLPGRAAQGSSVNNMQTIRPACRACRNGTGGRGVSWGYWIARPQVAFIPS